MYNLKNQLVDLGYLLLMCAITALVIWGTTSLEFRGHHT